MAQRYGGQFSPEPEKASKKAPARTAFAGKRRSKAGGRVNLMFLLPLPLGVRAFFSDPVTMAQLLVALGLLEGAAWMTREGLKAEDAYIARKVARRPVLPRKIIGAVLTGLGLATAGWATHGLIEAGIFGVLGGVLHVLAFGLDPLSDKGTDGIDRFQQDRVARLVDEAENHLRAMQEAILRTGDRKLVARVESFCATARDMFRTVEEDPRDLAPARKFLGVYLQGARDATQKFTDIYTRAHDAAARSDYETLLDDLERNFARRTEELLLDNKTDLEVEIEVLRERLQRGVH